MGGGGKGGGSQTIGYRYFMTIHMGLSRGPVDQITQIKVGDKHAWPVPEGTPSGADILMGLLYRSVAQFFPELRQKLLELGYLPSDQLRSEEALNAIRMNDSGITNIRAGNLFGGDKKEGGISGTLTVQMGNENQTFPGWVKTLMKGRVPDFRGVATMVFDGMICSMNPYPKTWKIRARRIHKGWDGPVWQPTLAKILLNEDRIWAMNPAHILYEVATNRGWGRGLDRSLINEAAWLEAAQTLYDEGMGLCIRWNRQTDLDEFVKEIVDHIGAAIYTDRATGLLTLKLIRDDYNPAEIPLFDYNSGLLRVEDPETATQEHSINEVVISYHDPLNDEDREVRAQNLAGIQSAGSPNSIKTTYKGIPTHELASRVAQRDLRVQSVGNRRYTVHLDRRAWRVHPGAVFRISAPDKGIDNLVLRAGDVREKDILDGQIQVECAVDVYGLPAAAFVEREENRWEPPQSEPAPSPYRLMREATWFDFARRLGPADLSMIAPSSAALATIAVRPNDAALSYNIHTRAGTEEFQTRGNEGWVPLVTIDDDIGPYTTAVPFINPVDMGLVQIGDMGQIGSEIVRVDDIAMNEAGDGGVITLGRGCVDTVPVAHNEGALLFIPGNAVGTDAREYVSGETVSVKALTVTSSASLDPDLAPTDTVTMVGRQGRPYPPANVRVNGLQALSGPGVSGDMAITWSHRDRVLQADQLIDWNQGSVGPEAGTVYDVRIYTGTSLQASQSNISGNSWTYVGSLTGPLTIEIQAKRNNVLSLQKVRFTVTKSL